jgi:hypothetical protein
MRKVTMLGAVFLVPIAVAIALVAIESGRPPDWQSQVDKYTAYMDEVLSQPMKMLKAQRARRPWDFGAQMSRAVYGDSGHYQTDYGYKQKNVGVKPLPFPPLEVWCVLLEVEHPGSLGATQAGAYSVVFPALHQDLHSADWVLHEGAGDVLSQEFKESLSKIGCDLELD